MPSAECTDGHTKGHGTQLIGKKFHRHTHSGTVRESERLTLVWELCLLAKYCS